MKSFKQYINEASHPKVDSILQINAKAIKSRGRAIDSFKPKEKRVLSQSEIEDSFNLRKQGYGTVSIAKKYGMLETPFKQQLKAHEGQPYYVPGRIGTSKKLQEAHKFYSDTDVRGPPMSLDDIRRYRMKDIMPKYQEHMTNMYILRHLNGHSTTPTNDKIDYTNQLAIAHKKMKNIVDTHPRFKREEVALRANHARIAAHARLGEMGYNDFALPKKMEDPKVANLPTTKDGRKLFGV